MESVEIAVITAAIGSLLSSGLLELTPTLTLISLAILTVMPVENAKNYVQILIISKDSNRLCATSELWLAF